MIIHIILLHHLIYQEVVKCNCHGFNCVKVREKQVGSQKVAGSDHWTGTKTKGQGGTVLSLLSTSMVEVPWGTVPHPPLHPRCCSTADHLIAHCSFFVYVFATIRRVKCRGQISCACKTYLHNKGLI